MASLIYCPDCGGVISQDVPDGTRRCSCADAPSPRLGMPDPAPKPKICVSCQADLTGKRRYHDSRGYWCEACCAADRAATEERGTPCASCGRKLDPMKLQSYEGLRICGRCFRERQERLRRPKAIPASRFAGYERKKILITLLVIFVVLMLVTIIRQF